VTLVHAKVSEESLRAVAKLYSELSTRVDPRSLALEVLAGEDPGKIVNWLGHGEGSPVFVGTHTGCSNMKWRSARVAAPLYVAQEEWFRTELSNLKLHPYPGQTEWTNRSGAPSERLGFGGTRADVSDVLDGLRVLPGSVS